MRKVLLLGQRFIWGLQYDVSLSEYVFFTSWVKILLNNQYFRGYAEFFIHWTRVLCALQTTIWKPWELPSFPVTIFFSLRTTDWCFLGFETSHTFNFQIASTLSFSNRSSSVPGTHYTSVAIWKLPKLFAEDQWTRGNFPCSWYG